MPEAMALHSLRNDSVPSHVSENYFNGHPKKKQGEGKKRKLKGGN